MVEAAIAVYPKHEYLFVECYQRIRLSKARARANAPGIGPVEIGRRSRYTGNTEAYLRFILFMLPPMAISPRRVQ